MPEKANATNGSRPRGRPRLDIDPDAVADAVAELFAEGGHDAVSIPDAAEKLSVSRATLYRTVPTKDHLLGILFERSTRELTEHARDAIERIPEPRDKLHELVRLQVDAAIRMRSYMPVFFGGGELPSDVFSRWHTWSREFEAMWVQVVTEAMATGDLDEADPVVTTRLLLGMCIWVSRWYRPSGPYDGDMIADTAIRLLRAGGGPPVPEPSVTPPRRKRSRS